RERSRREDQRVGGRERVDGGGTALEQALGDEIAAGADDLLAVQFAPGDRAGPQVDVVVRAHRGLLVRPDRATSARLSATRPPGKESPWNSASCSRLTPTTPPSRTRIAPSTRASPRRSRRPIGSATTPRGWRSTTSRTSTGSCPTSSPTWATWRRARRACA